LCPARTWSETHPQVRSRSTLTERARVWACRRIGQHGQTVTAVAKDLGVRWGTVMRAVRDYGAPLVDAPDRLAGVTSLGVHEHVVRHEVLLVRMEVRDLHILVVVAAGELAAAWRRGSPGVGGSSRDNVGAVWDYRTRRARSARREGVREEPVS
jgi:hypothetical protein